MAITDKKTGVWGLDQTYNKINQGSIWTYSGTNALFNWGINTHGQLGQNNTTTVSSPIQLSGTTWSQEQFNKYAGGNGTCGSTKTDGTLWVWGPNGYGELGLSQPTNTHVSSPTQVPGTTWSTFSMPYESSYATKTDGTLWAWGNNQYGQLGINNKTLYSSPKQVPGTTWKQGDGSWASVCVTKTDGTLYCWGKPEGMGLHAQNNNTEYSSPRQVPGTTWDTVRGGYSHMVAVKTDGTLWGWGSDGYGALGLNSNTPETSGYSSPKQVPGTTWNYISAGLFNTIATKTDGTLWAWGLNSSGELGVNNRTQYSSPVQIPGTTWDKVASGRYMNLATKTDGTLWAWGKPLTPDNAYYSSPTQVGSGDEWGWPNVSTYADGVRMVSRIL